MKQQSFAHDIAKSLVHDLWVLWRNLGLINTDGDEETIDIDLMRQWIKERVC